MNHLTHQQARKYVQASLNGRLNDDRQAVLEAHLAGCRECRVYAGALRQLEDRLNSTGQALEQALPASSTGFIRSTLETRQAVIRRIQTGSRRLSMKNNVLSFGRTIATVLLVLVVGFGAYEIGSRLVPGSEGNKPQGLIQFTSGMNRYLASPDGKTVWQPSANIPEAARTVPGVPASVTLWPETRQQIISIDNSSSRQLFLAGYDGAGLTAITPPCPRTVDDFIFPSPAGDRLAVFCVSSDQTSYALYTVELPSGASILQADHITGSPEAQWSPDGLSLAYSESTTKQAGENFLVVKNLWLVPAGGDGSRLLVEGMSTTPGFPGILFRPVYQQDFAWSPDGRSLYYACSRPACPNGVTIRQLDPADGSETDLLRLPEEVVSVRALHPSSTGRGLAFVSVTLAGESKIMLLPEGSSQPTVLTQTSHLISSVAWSPDETWLAYSTFTADEILINTSMYLLDMRQPGEHTAIPLGLEGYNLSWLPQDENLAASPALAEGCHFTLRGKVTSANDRKILIPGARIRLSFELTPGSFETTSNADGSYSLDVEARFCGTIRLLTITADGYVLIAESGNIKLGDLSQPVVENDFGLIPQENAP